MSHFCFYAGSHLVATTISIFLFVTFARFEIFSAVYIDGSVTELPNNNDIYDPRAFAVEVIMTPFLYVDERTRKSYADEFETSERNQGNFKSIAGGYSNWKFGMDLMPTCAEFGGIAASAKCAHDAAGNKQACAAAVDTHQYEMDCHAVRGLWTVGAVMLFVAFALLVYHTTHTEELQPGALMAVGSILFCSAIVFTAYTVVYISVLDGISTLVVTNGVSAHDYAVNLFSTLDTLLYVCALMFIYASMKLQRSGSSGTSTIYQKMNNAFFFADA